MEVKEDERTLYLSQFLDPAITEGCPPLHFAVRWSNELPLPSSPTPLLPPLPPSSFPCCLNSCGWLFGLVWQLTVFTL